MRTLLKRTLASMYSIKQLHVDKFIFIHIIKTGGKSVEKILNLQLEHMTALKKIEEIGRNRWEEKLTFSIVRNPWDRVVSHYHYRVQKNITGLHDDPIEFNEWVLRCYGNKEPRFYDNPQMFMPQVDWLVDMDGKMLVNEVLYFENLDVEFNRVMKVLGMKRALPHLNKTARGSYREYYDQESIEIVERCFERDIVRFGYSF